MIVAADTLMTTATPLQSTDDGKELVGKFPDDFCNLVCKKRAVSVVWQFCLLIARLLQFLKTSYGYRVTLAFLNRVPRSKITECTESLLIVLGDAALLFIKIILSAELKENGIHSFLCPLHLPDLLI